MKSNSKKLLAALLAVAIAATPLPVFAEDSGSSGNANQNVTEDNTQTTNDDSETTSGAPIVFSEKDSTLAPGVTQKVCYSYDNNGKQVVYYTATADITRDDVKTFVNYKDNQNDVYGMSKLTEQIASAEAKHKGENYSVVAACNGDFYNMTTGKPSGAFVMEGNDVTSGNDGDNHPFFAILKDGTAVIGKSGEYKTYKEQGNLQEAIGGSTLLVYDGQVQTMPTAQYNTSKAPRSTVGITAEGKVVIMSADGRQEPFSAGLTTHEQAEIMYELGCKYAIELDGGGSTTFVSKEEGSDEHVIINRPSDGSERSISNSLMIVSTAAPTDTFDHAVLTAEHEYVTPGSTVNVSAKGVSPAGTSAAVPENVTWQMKDSSLGSVENGVFTSNGTAGDAEVQMALDGQVVGTTIIHIVKPASIVFNQEQIAVPYGKTTPLELTAKCDDLHEVVLKASDIKFTLSDEKLGTIDGFSFTACNEDSGLTSGTITAVSVFDESIKAEASISLGKGSEVVEDFEGENAIGKAKIESTYPNYAGIPETDPRNRGQLELGNISIVNQDKGKVHSGQQSMRVDCDYSQTFENGYLGLNLTLPKEIDIKGAKSVGIWIYVPEDALASMVRLGGIEYDSEGNQVGEDTVVSDYFIKNGQCLTYDSPGWHYYSWDISKMAEVKLTYMQFFTNDRDMSDYNYLAKEHNNQNGKFTYYLDDITVDYSSVVADREVPVLSDPTIFEESGEGTSEINGQTINYNNITVSAKVVDDTSKNNYTGINPDSCKLYVDGIEQASKYTNGMILGEDINLINGVHTIRFYAEDKMGNANTLTRQITVNSDKNDKATISIVPENTATSGIALGSLYWVDVVASDVEKIDSTTLTLNLCGIHDWELDHMEIADGFTADYSVKDDNNDATITIKRNSESVGEGKTVLARLPIRVWYSTTSTYPGYEKWTPEAIWAYKALWGKEIDLSMEYGLINYVDGTTGSYSMDKIKAVTEVYGNYAAMNANGDYTGKSSWHLHNAESLPDKAPTCTKDGYTGRTYCKDCDSIVDWGTTIPATGHKWEFIDGILKCSVCGELYNGEYEGKSYKDGAALNGWIEDSYYKDGIKFTGIQKVDGYYYDFGENGICEGKVKYTGLFKDGEVYRYSQLGVISTGWKEIDGDWYYFDPSTKSAAVGERYMFDGVKYIFEETGRLTDGVWVTKDEGTMYYYGPSYYENGWTIIHDEIYYFKNKYRYEGYNFIKDSNSSIEYLCNFGDDGALVEKVQGPGIYNVKGENYYIENGVKTYAGLIMIDGYYYYIHTSGQVATGRNYIYKNNDIFPNGWYDFDENGRMIIKNGLIKENDGLYYYENSQLVYAGLIKIDGYYYYIHSSGQAATGRNYIYKNNGLLPSGWYDFDDAGRMINVPDTPEVKNGLVKEDDGLYYYENGERVYAGLIKVDGYYYYIQETGKAATGTCEVTKTNGLLPAGTYEFDEECRMINVPAPEVKNGLVQEDDGIYYYENGVKTYAGLIKIGDYYYYIHSSGKAATGRNYIYKNNDIFPSGWYDFDENSRMIIKNGIVKENDSLYYYENNLKVYAGLIMIDGYYYYVHTSGEVAIGRNYVYKNNGLLPSDWYNFDEEGRMINVPTPEVKNGLVKEEDGLYYYENGERVYAGLIKVDGYYYYIQETGKAATGTCEVTKTNGLLPAGTYEFDEECRMINIPTPEVKNGLVQEEDGLYYYENGVKTYAGLIKIGDYYYYIHSSGKAATGRNYIYKNNDIFPSGWYDFDENGRMIIKNGIVKENDSLYYYENNLKVYAGLIMIDGYYYYVHTSGEVAIGRNYVYKNNGLLPSDWYNFDEEGKMINVPTPSTVNSL